MLMTPSVEKRGRLYRLSHWRAPEDDALFTFKLTGHYRWFKN
jgi:hypothetical protein